MSTLERVRRVFRDVFDDPALPLERDSHAGEVPGWDSLANIDLISALEHEFAVRFALGELDGLKDVGDLVDRLEAKLSARRAS